MSSSSSKEQTQKFYVWHDFSSTSSHHSKLKMRMSMEGWTLLQPNIELNFQTIVLLWESSFANWEDEDDDQRSNLSPFFSFLRTHRDGEECESFIPITFRAKQISSINRWEMKPPQHGASTRFSLLQLSSSPFLKGETSSSSCLLLFLFFVFKEKKRKIKTLLSAVHVEEPNTKYLRKIVSDDIAGETESLKHIFHMLYVTHPSSAMNRKPFYG